MLTPVDGWTAAHGLAGFFLGRIKFNRFLFYPIPIGWEIYQLFFHYQPQGEYLAYVWLNSVCDILACVICYEVAMRYSIKYERHPLWMRISNQTKAVAAYVVITCVITWVFYDDIFRGGLSARMPTVQIPLVLGALSPAIASFIVRKWIKRETFHIARFSRLSFKQLSYYTFTGILPSAVILLIISLVITL